MCNNKKMPKYSCKNNWGASTKTHKNAVRIAYHKERGRSSVLFEKQVSGMFTPLTLEK
jgi:hypothetical protein